MATGAQIAQLAKEQMAQLTIYRPETVSKLTKVDDGWHVTVDMLELKRIPASTDILAAYDMVLDCDGNVLSYARTRRYSRGQPEQEVAA
jgi:hypothetical protein